MVQAIREALRQAMKAMPKVIVLGEDVAGGAGLGPPREGSMGGTFGVTKGPLEEFGSVRVRDTPISEAGFTGTAISGAAAGLRPVVDLMWSSFAPLAFDQIMNQAAKMRYMFGGQATVPVVFRMAIGAGLSAAGCRSLACPAAAGRRHLGQPGPLPGPSRLAPQAAYRLARADRAAENARLAWSSSPGGPAGDHVEGLSQVHPQRPERRLRRTNAVSREDSRTPAGEWSSRDSN
jgi:hypothetical protein